MTVSHGASLRDLYQLRSKYIAKTPLSDIRYERARSVYTSSQPLLLTSSGYRKVEEDGHGTKGHRHTVALKFQRVP